MKHFPTTFMCGTWLMSFYIEVAKFRKLFREYIAKIRSAVNYICISERSRNIYENIRLELRGNAKLPMLDIQFSFHTSFV